MKKSIITPIIILFLLSACSPALAPTVTVEPEGQPAPAATEEVKTGSAPVDECVKCHTDKDQLISTAKPVEVVIKESEGTG